MKVARLFISHTRQTRHVRFAAGIALGTFLFAGAVSAQTIDPDLRPDLQRALAAQTETFDGQASGQANGQVSGRANSYVPARAEGSRATPVRPGVILRPTLELMERRPHLALPRRVNIPATNSIQPGTPLTQVLAYLAVEFEFVRGY